MSLFLSNITKIFKNQNLIERNGFYFDEAFRFKKDDTKEQYKFNCFISENMEKTYELFKDTFLGSRLNLWKNNDYNYPFISYEDIKKGYYTYIKYGGKESEDDWQSKWKNILKNFTYAKKEDFEEEIFEKMYFYKYNDENKISEMLKEYDKKFTFKRISELNKNLLPNRKYKIFENEIDCNNISQGELGTCYFLWALAVLSNFPQLLYQLFPKEDIDESGYYQICLFHNGEWQKVLIDDYLVIDKKYNTFAFTQPVNDCLFSCLLEKAYAKILGSYADANGGNEYNAFKALTGYDSLVFKNEYFNDYIYHLSYERIKLGNFLSCSTKRHAYSLLDIDEDKKNNENIYEFKVRNPWNYLKKEEEIYNERRNNNSGIMHLIKDEYEDQFKKYFEGELVICQALFGYTVYNYKLKSTTPKVNYFKFEIFKNSKIYIGIYDDNYEGIFSTIKIKYKDLNKENEDYKNLKIDDPVKQEIMDKYYHFNKDSNYNRNRFYKFQELEKSKYILSISSENDYVNNQILRIIIQGNIEINYLGDNENLNNNNDIEPLLFDRYNYGMKTAEMFEEYKSLIKVLEKKCKVKMHKELEVFI